jgi:hypothetical protein
MRYILDFDHTLFDTSQFITDVCSAGLTREQYISPEIWERFDASAYLYDDVLPFLRVVGKDQVQILTAITPELGPHSAAFQRAKLDRSGIGAYVHSVHFMEGLKGTHVAKLYDQSPTIFVDDRHDQLRSVVQICPEVQVVEIVRTKVTSENSAPPQAQQWHVINSLVELPI